MLFLTNPRLLSRQKDYYAGIYSDVAQNAQYCSGMLSIEKVKYSAE